MSDLPLLLRANAAMYGACLEKASKGTLKNWIILPAAVVMLFLFYTLAALVSPLGMAGGFLMGLIFCLFLAQYYSWLSRTREGEKIHWKSLATFEFGLFQGVISAAFILFIFDWLIGSLLIGLDEAAWIIGLSKLAIILLFNPLAEVVYIREEYDLSAFQRAYKFTMEHWIEWFIPYLIIFAPLYFAGSLQVATIILARTNVLFPSSPVFISLQTYFPGEPAAMVIGVVLVHWLMLFRAELFEALDTGNRRMRIYKYKNS